MRLQPSSLHSGVVRPTCASCREAPCECSIQPPVRPNRLALPPRGWKAGMKGNGKHARLRTEARENQKVNSSCLADIRTSWLATALIDYPATLGADGTGISFLASFFKNPHYFPPTLIASSTATRLGLVFVRIAEQTTQTSLGLLSQQQRSS